ncbi:MAG: hypothetical protein IPM79_12490 [Polyangiaceae bacterium]|nr:hypothetical protein [Polyangiaceae bacterium]
MKSQPLRAVVFPEDGAWVAQCVDLDVAAYGRTADAAAENLRDSLSAAAALDKKEGRAPFDGLDPAPEMFRARFEQLQWRREFDAPTTVGTTPAWMLVALEAERLSR